jgi:hypothetical protein
MEKKTIANLLVCILIIYSLSAIASANVDETSLYWLYYDSDTYGSCVGIQGYGNDVWFEGAIKLTPAELIDYDGWSITVVKIYLSPYSSTHTGYIQIYVGGTSDTPGDLLIKEPYTVTGKGWKEISLSEPLTIDANEDIWVSVNITHDDGEAPLSYDNKIASAGKVWVNVPILGLKWKEMAIFGFGNWMLRAGIEKLNRLPVADAGGSYSGYTDESLILDGSGSYDLDGTIVLYEWDFNGDSIYDWSSTITGATDYIYNMPGCYDATLRVTDDENAIDTDIATVNIEKPPEDELSVKSYVLLANERIEIRKDTVIKSGDVGVNSVNDGSTETLTIGKNVKVLDSSSLLKADFIKLQKNVEVWDIHYDYINKHKQAKILGSEYTPLTLPVATFPSFPEFSSGSLDITVKKNDIYTIDQGEYGNIRVHQGGKLIFTGGIYNIVTLITSKNVQLVFQDTSEARIENSLIIGKNGIIESDDSFSASDIVFYVAGEDTNDSKAVTIGMNGKIDANIYAPNGTILLRKNTVATGSFIGNNVVIGKSVQLTWDSAFQ